VVHGKSEIIIVSVPMPSIQMLKISIQRLRQKEEASPPKPNNFDFIITEQYRNTSDSEFILNYDSRYNTKLPRILNYITKKKIGFYGEL